MGNASKETRGSGIQPENQASAPEARTGTPSATSVAPRARAQLSPDEVSQTLEDIYSDEAVRISQPPISAEGEGEKRATYRTSYYAKKRSKTVAKETAVVLISILDGLASMAFGPEAAMNKFEREFIQEPLERILSRMDIVSSEIVSRWSDPIMLVMGLIIWGSRISRMNSERRANDDDEDNPPDDTPEIRPPSNGRATEILIAEALSAPQVITSQIAGDKIE